MWSPRFFFLCLLKEVHFKSHILFLLTNHKCFFANFSLISSPKNGQILYSPANREIIRSPYMEDRFFKSKFVEIIVFVTLSLRGNILEFIIVNNSANFTLFILSVPKSSMISKSTFNKFS